MAAFKNTLTKVKDGGLKHTMPAHRSLAPSKGVLNRAGVDPALVRETDMPAYKGFEEPDVGAGTT